MDEAVRGQSGEGKGIQSILDVECAQISLLFTLGVWDRETCEFATYRTRPSSPGGGSLRGSDNSGSFVQALVRSRTVLYFGDSYTVFEAQCESKRRHISLTRGVRGCRRVEMAVKLGLARWLWQLTQDGWWSKEFCLFQITLENSKQDVSWSREAKQQNQKYSGLILRAPICTTRDSSPWRICRGGYARARYTGDGAFAAPGRTWHGPLVTARPPASRLQRLIRDRDVRWGSSCRLSPTA